MLGIWAYNDSRTWLSHLEKQLVELTWMASAVPLSPNVRAKQMYLVVSMCIFKNHFWLHCCFTFFLSNFPLFTLNLYNMVLLQFAANHNMICLFITEARMWEETSFWLWQVRSWYAVAPLVVIQTRFRVFPEYVNIGALYIFFSPVESRVLDNTFLLVNNTFYMTSLCSHMLFIMIYFY